MSGAGFLRSTLRALEKRGGISQRRNGWPQRRNAYLVYLFVFAFLPAELAENRETLAFPLVYHIVAVLYSAALLSGAAFLVSQLGYFRIMLARGIG